MTSPMSERSAHSPRRARRQGRSHIGASGWSYDHWQDRFYPKDLAKKDRFAFFASRFETVELNATFYRLFQESTFRKWAGQAPDGSLYVRFHGSPEMYSSAYDDKTLADWAARLSRELRSGRDIFAYFNNDIDAHAVDNARQLCKLLHGKTGSC